MAIPTICITPNAPSLPVRGAWVEISFAEMLTSEKKSRSPCGERGLKYELKEKLCEELQGRSPCGERGLKSREAHPMSEAVGSLPVRGAWVEILVV